MGALTTADFRFGARPWELNTAASLCNHCPVGCNLIFNVRREAFSGGKTVIKRVMPRQNEAVNEIWICDKGRFAYHYAESAAAPDASRWCARTASCARPPGTKPSSLVADKLREAGSGLVTLAGGRLANEDLFNLHQLNPGGEIILYSYMGGGDLTAQVGLGPGQQFWRDGQGHAPSWWSPATCTRKPRSGGCASSRPPSAAPP